MSYTPTPQLTCIKNSLFFLSVGGRFILIQPILIKIYHENLGASNTKRQIGEFIFGTYGRVNHKIFMVPMEYLIIKHLEINKKERNEFKDTK